jgi:hypothetical protein
MRLGGGELTSPSNRSILKLRLLIFSCGELGKQTMQFVNEYTMSRKYVPNDPIVPAIVVATMVVWMPIDSLRLGT